MENSEIGKYTKSFGLSFAITSVVSALLVIVKESSEVGVLAWKKESFNHPFCDLMASLQQSLEIESH